MAAMGLAATLAERAARLVERAVRTPDAASFEAEQAEATSSAAHARTLRVASAQRRSCIMATSFPR